MENKLIFLDVDGVMTNFHDEIGSYMTHLPDKYGVSPTNLNILLDFCKETNTKVMISSNWRKHTIDGYWRYNGENYKNPLRELKKVLGDFYIGDLPPIRHTTKAEAMILWFEENDYNPGDLKFVIFDDDLRENLHTTHDYRICEHTIITNPKTGLTIKDIEKAKEILKM